MSCDRHRQNAAGFALNTPQGEITASRILMATGAWLKPTAAMLGVDLPVNARINTVSVTERLEPLTSTVIGHATGLLTMKQKTNGTVLIGGGWQGRGTPQEGRGQVTAGSSTQYGLSTIRTPCLGKCPYNAKLDWV